MSKKDLETKGYNVVYYDLNDLSKTSSFNPFKALKKLADENPVKFEKVVNEL